MRPRIPSPVLTVPDALEALQALGKAANQAAGQAGLPEATVNLVCQPASQINGPAVTKQEG
jgi:hypothetical protein